jgi:hypothetical protein
MKSIIQTITILLLLTISISSCKKSFVPTSPYGSNTIQCKINGVLFETSGPYESNPVGCESYVQITGGLNGNTVHAKMCKGEYNTLSLISWQPFELGTFIIGSDGTWGATVYSQSSIYFQTFDISNLYQIKNAGSITVSHLTDTYIAGTFSFVAKNVLDSTQSVTVSDGKFDVALQ